MIAPARQPIDDVADRDAADFAGRDRPAGEHFGLDLGILRAEHPVGRPLHHRIADGFETPGRRGGRGGTERRTEPLVAALVLVHGVDDGGIERIDRIERRKTVIAERRIDRQAARRALGHQPVEPVMRHQIEQRRGGDQLDRPVERGLEVARKIDRHGRHRQVRRLREPGGAREQAQVVVDQAPALPPRQALGHCPQGGAKPAGEIDHRDRGTFARPGGDRIEHRRIARAPVVGLAQRQPASRRTRSYGPLDRPGEQLGRSAPGRKLGGARPRRRAVRARLDFRSAGATPPRAPGRRPAGPGRRPAPRSRGWRRRSCRSPASP